MLMLLTWKTLVIEHAQKPIFRLYVYYLLWLTVEYYKYRMKLRRFGLFISGRKGMFIFVPLDLFFFCFLLHA